MLRTTSFVAVLVLASSSAAADPVGFAADRPEADSRVSASPVSTGMIRAARAAASRGDCIAARSLEARSGREDLQVGFMCTSGSAEPRTGPTFEGAFGMSALTTSLGGLGVSPGASLGLGKFVTPDTAVSLRLTAIADVRDTSAVGVLAPHAQTFVSPRWFLGAGIGAAYMADCEDGCDAGFGLGATARLGRAFRPHGLDGWNLVLEGSAGFFPTPFGFAIGGYAATLNVGYQVF